MWLWWQLRNSEEEPWELECRCLRKPDAALLGLVPRRKLFDASWGWWRLHPPAAVGWVRAAMRWLWQDPHVQRKRGMHSPLSSLQPLSRPESFPRPEPIEEAASKDRI